MAKRDIPQAHIDNLNAMVGKLQTVLDVDTKEIQTQLNGAGFSKYPKTGETHAINALTMSQQMLFRPLQGVVMCVSPPHFLKMKTSLMQFALVKHSLLPDKDYEFPFNWVVFPGSRQILTVSGSDYASGLVIDTKGDMSTYKKDSLFEDRGGLDLNALQKIAEMIQLFPTKEGSRESELAFDAIADLTRT